MKLSYLKVNRTVKPFSNFKGNFFQSANAQRRGLGRNKRTKISLAWGIVLAISLKEITNVNILKLYMVGLPGFKAKIQLNLLVMSDDHINDEGEGLQLQEAKPAVKKPPLYKVVLLNDDYTPMDFVVHVLESFFKMNRDKATQVMLQVHTEGKGVCGVFTREIAETKVAQVNDFARSHQHPLLCTMERT